MKSIVIALFFLSAIQVYGEADSRPQRFEHQDECGDPTVESMSWALLEGTGLSGFEPKRGLWGNAARETL